MAKQAKNAFLHGPTARTQGGESIALVQAGTGVLVFLSINTPPGWPQRSFSQVVFRSSCPWNFELQKKFVLDLRALLTLNVSFKG